MDFGINFALNLINHNGKKNFNDDFDPPQNALHLAGDENFYQYSPLLYGNQDGDWKEGPYQNGQLHCLEVNDENYYDHKRFKVCSECSKDQRTPNANQKEQLRKVIIDIKSNPNIVPQDILYDRKLLSPNPEDYCKLDILTFFSNRMVKKMGLPDLKCWNGANCKVPVESNRKNRSNVRSEVVEKSIIIRYFEGIDSNGWILAPKF